MHIWELPFQHRPKRGRKRTAESIAKRLGTIESELATASSLQRLQLLQERRDLQAEQTQMAGNSTDIGALESEFAKVAKAYSDRKGIAYATWRDMGVPADVLKKAGVGR